MTVKESIYARKSTRVFLPDRQVPEETIRELIETAGRAPSWCSSQPWEVYVVTGEKMKELKAAWKAESLKGVPQSFDRSDVPGPGFDDWNDAPLCLENMTIWKENRLESMGVSGEEYHHLLTDLFINQFDAATCVYLCMNKSLSPYSFYDLGAFGQTLMLAATEKGIDSFAAYSPVIFGDLLHKELGIPENTNIVLGIYLGYKNPGQLVDKPDAKQMSLDKYLHIFS